MRVLFFGGNGHGAARLGPARAALAALPEPPFELTSVPYPGFEGRARAASFEAFLDATAAAAGGLAGERTCVYATGVGGLVVLCLRARGALRDAPAIFQAPVLWGLERRWMPRLLRLVPAHLLLRRAFASPRFQRRFVGKHFLRPPDPEVRDAFFEGYAQCTALPDFFAWLTPALLRSLEADHARDPAILAGVRFVWGDRDTVVPPAEVAWTEQALGVRLAVETVAGWGHYPMIDDPPGWASVVRRLVG
jgi:pimeloyl-ACP methyl ester carboxylesterase